MKSGVLLLIGCILANCSTPPPTRTAEEPKKEEVKVIETTEGVMCWRKSVAIEKVGLYIPGGSAPLFSTILMLSRKNGRLLGIISARGTC